MLKSFYKEYYFVPEAYLNCKIEEIKIPISARHTIFVCDGHRYRGQAVGQNGNPRAICNIRHREWYPTNSAGCRLRREEWFSLRGRRAPTEVAHLYVRYFDVKIFILLVVHFGLRCARVGKEVDVEDVVASSSKGVDVVSIGYGRRESREGTAVNFRYHSMC